MVKPDYWSEMYGAVQAYERARAEYFVHIATLAQHREGSYLCTLEQALMARPELHGKLAQARAQVEEAAEEQQVRPLVTAYVEA